MRWQFAANAKPLWPLIAAFLVGISVWFATHLSAGKPRESISFSVKSAKVPSPKPEEPTQLQRGQMVYNKYGCAICHGTQGKEGIKNPNSQTGEIPAVIYVKESYTLHELKTRILKGVTYIPPADPNKPLPPYRMPGWGDRMTEQEADDLCEYLFSLMPKEAEEEW